MRERETEKKGGGKEREKEGRNYQSSIQGELSIKTKGNGHLRHIKAEYFHYH